MSEMNKKKETTDLNLVAYLELKGIFYDGIRKDDRLILFSYPWTEELERLIEEYYSNETEVPAKFYADRLRRVRIVVAELLKDKKSFSQIKEQYDRRNK